MKISKLFHWLYAILMFLPILVFIPNAFYYGFNKEAVAQQKTEQVPVYYESNEVITRDDLHSGYVYYYKNNLPSIAVDSNKFLFDIKVTENLSFIPNYQNVIACRIYLSTSGSLTLRATYNNSNNIFIDIKAIPFDFVFLNATTDFSYTDLIINYIEESNLKLVKEYQSVTTNMSITDSMSYAWKSVWQNDLFSWTNNTFLNEPFVYITDLFSIPFDNVLINALSYWLDISIIWLVFDVIMYVPLLTHRWLDKGMVE